jgi:hypothetical protein
MAAGKKGHTTRKDISFTLGEDFAVYLPIVLK